jgi:PAS domain S-box-containing protein
MVYFRELELLPVGIFVAEGDGFCVFVNQFWRSLSGLSAQEALGRGWIRALHPEDRERVLHAWREAAAAGKVFESEYRFRAPTGEVTWVWTRAAIPQAAGQAGGHLGITVDITSRKQAEQERERERTFLREALHQMPAGVIIAEAPSGRLLLRNQQAAATLGRYLIPCDDVPDYAAGRGLHPDGRPYRPEEWPLARSLRTGEVVMDEPIEVLRDDGTRRTLHASSAPIRSPAGEIVAAVLTLRDVTERKYWQQEQEATLRRGQAAKEEAEQANRAKDRFLAVMSHELRTPLNAVLGWAQLLRAGHLEPEAARKAIETIERSARHQVTILDDLLDIARMTAGKIRLDCVPVDLAHLTDVCVRSLAPEAEAKGIRLEARLAAGVTVRGDPDRLKQVMTNLLSNAIKFTPREGHVEIRLTATPRQCEWVVEDTGPGIPAETLPHLFEPFRQADAVSTRATGGLGLGLAIALQLAELHGGSIQASNRTDGPGAVFKLVLPMTAAEACPQQTPAENESGPAGERCLGAKLTGVRVLVVDDDPDARELITWILRECEADVSTAVSPEDAIRLVERWDPHVVLSDIAMPGESGYTLLQRLRETGRQGRERLPVIAVTGLGTREESDRVRRAGFEAIIAKPFEASRLTNLVAEFARTPGGGLPGDR